jgi:hypothetical protein
VSRRIESRFILHGTLVGAVAALIYLALTRAQPEPFIYIVAHTLNLAGGACGGFVPNGSTVSGGESLKPSRKSRAMFVFHRDEFHAHTLLGATSLDSGTSAYLTCRRINKQLK